MMRSPWNGSVIIALQRLYEKTIAYWTFRPCYDRTARETFWRDAFLFILSCCQQPWCEHIQIFFARLKDAFFALAIWSAFPFCSENMVSWYHRSLWSSHLPFFAFKCFFLFILFGIHLLCIGSSLALCSRLCNDLYFLSLSHCPYHNLILFRSLSVEALCKVSGAWNPLARFLFHICGLGWEQCGASWYDDGDKRVAFSARILLSTAYFRLSKRDSCSSQSSRNLPPMLYAYLRRSLVPFSFLFYLYCI